MFKASLTPKSITVPIVPDSTLILDLFVVRYALAPPVTVNVAVFLLGLPYSTGCLYYFSDALLCDETLTIAFFICPASNILLASINPKQLVEHAPYIPINGIAKFLAA